MPLPINHQAFYGLGLGLADIPYQSPTHLGNNSMKSIDTTYDRYGKGGIPDHTHKPFGGAEAESFHAFYEDRVLSAVAIALLTPGIEGLNGMNTRPNERARVSCCHPEGRCTRASLSPTMLGLLK